MRVERYDTNIAVQRMSTDIFKELELFREEQKCYFDKYHICPSEFRIPIGYKVILSQIQKFIANKLFTDKIYFMPELICASRIASELENEDSSPSFSQHASNGSNPDTPIDINLNAEHVSLLYLNNVYNLIQISLLAKDEANIICSICQKKTKIHSSNYPTGKIKQVPFMNFFCNLFQKISLKTMN
ncbi:hypothetical protein ACFW04_011917 [Cataglyphis niger]